MVPLTWGPRHSCRREVRGGAPAKVCGSGPRENGGTPTKVTGTPRRGPTYHGVGPRVSGGLWEGPWGFRVRVKGGPLVGGGRVHGCEL